jgi:prepilin signal peptidase PulO-like enzyme (type II secretory pathway)
MMTTFDSTRLGVAALCLAWMACTFWIAMRNERADFELCRRPAAHVIGGIALAILGIALTIPQPWNATAAVCIAGLGVAAWSDWRTMMLWDEIIVPTTLLCLGESVVFHIATSAATGGVVCGLFALLVYGVGQALGKDSGFGDVKAATLMGIALGPVCGMAAFFLASIFTIIIARVNSRARGAEIPFGPGLALATIVIGLIFAQINGLLSFAV